MCKNVKKVHFRPLSLHSRILISPEARGLGGDAGHGGLSGHEHQLARALNRASTRGHVLAFVQRLMGGGVRLLVNALGLNRFSLQLFEDPQHKNMESCS